MWNQWWPTAEDMANFLMHLARGDFETALALQRQALSGHSILHLAHMAAPTHDLLSFGVNSAQHRTLSVISFVMTALVTKRVVLKSNCPFLEIPLQSEHSAWFPNALQQVLDCIERPDIERASSQARRSVDAGLW